VQSLLARVNPHFDLNRARTPQPSSSAACASAAAPEPSGAASALPAAVASGASGIGAAAAAHAQRAGKNLVMPDEWAERHKDVLSKIPKEAQPPAAPHGPPLSEI
jgi:hypothetical protein